MRSRNCWWPARGWIARLPKGLAFRFSAIVAAFTASCPAFARDQAVHSSGDDTLSEFVVTCAGVDRLKTLLSNARKRGWEPIDSADHPFAARRLADFNTSLAANAGGQRPLIAVFRREIGGHELVLIVQDIRLPNSRLLPRISLCDVYDLADVPSYEALQSVFGAQRSHYDDTLPSPPVVDSVGGVSWLDGFGLPGASVTKVSTWRDEYMGRYVHYSASKQYWKFTQARRPDTIPPPIVLTPSATPEASKPQD